MSERVLILIENETFPSDERVRKEALTLVDAGYEVRLAVPTDEGYEALEETLFGVRVFRYPRQPEGSGTLAYLREYATAMWGSWRTIRRATRGWKPDVVFVTNPPDFQMLLALPFRRRGARIVFDHHDLSPELFEVKFGRRGAFYKLLLAAERLAFRSADVVLSSNDSYAEVARTRGGVDPDRIFVVRNGPDPERIYAVEPDPALRRGKEHLVVWLGRMSAQEGLDVLVDAADQLVKRIGRTDAVFALVGPGDVRAELQRDVALRGLEDYVYLPGRADDDQVRAYLSTADVCVTVDCKSPMNDRSTMVKTLEYMAVGKPVLMFPLDETARVAGEAAVYANEDDAGDLADKLDALLSDPARRLRLGAAAQRRVNDGFSWPSQAPALLEALRRPARSRHR